MVFVTLTQHVPATTVIRRQIVLFDHVLMVFHGFQLHQVLTPSTLEQPSARAWVLAIVPLACVLVSLVLLVEHVIEWDVIVIVVVMVVV